MIAYERRSTPLHTARAGAGAAYCGALALGAMLFDHPAVLAALGLAALGAGVASGVGRRLGATVRLGLGLLVLIAAVNALVSREGLTVVARLGTVPVLGRIDVTLEALAYGLVSGLRVIVLVLAAALYVAAVDPDEVLRAFRRVSFRSALTATLATRMVPVLARDATRLADGQRCRPGAPAGRLALVRAVAGGALDRAVDVAAALEVRGYGVGGRPARSRRAWSRHDLGFAVAAAALAAGLVVARIAGLAVLEPYPRFVADTGAGTWLLAVAVLLVAALPHLDRRGVG